MYTILKILSICRMLKKSPGAEGSEGCYISLVTLPEKNTYMVITDAGFPLCYWLDKLNWFAHLDKKCELYYFMYLLGTIYRATMHQVYEGHYTEHSDHLAFFRRTLGTRLGTKYMPFAVTWSTNTAGADHRLVQKWVWGEKRGIGVKFLENLHV